MTVADWISAGIGVTGVALATRFYLELWRWAKQCQNARIVVAHKRRVQIDAPLTDWLSWANQLNDKQKESGRIVYRNGYVAVAILRPKTASRVARAIRRTRKNRRERAPSVSKS